MSDDKQRIVADIDSETHDALKEKLEHGELSEIIRDVANTVAYGGGWDRTTVIERQIRDKRETIRSLRQDRRDLDNRIEKEEEALQQLLRDREEIETEGEQFAGAVWSFEKDFRAGDVGHIFADHPKVTAIADEFGKDPDAVIDELRERNPDIPDCAFTQIQHADDRFNGVEEYGVAVDTPVDDREEVGER